MSKRKLTRRQAWRAEKIQAERRARANKKTQHLAATLAGSELGPEQPGRIITRYGAQVELEDKNRVLHRCLLRRNLPPLVCGDRVAWQASRDNTGVVVAMEPRQSLLERPDADNQLKPVAANIDQILVVAAPLPALDTDLINRYLVAAEITRISPLLVINKTDLLDEQTLRNRLHVYQDIGYPVVYTSCRRSDGQDTLLTHLRDKTSIFVGQSGVGKSSLIQALLPKEALRVGELSETSGLGRHTTTATRLYHFPGGGELIDSPGVRAFRLSHASLAQITEGFAEFRPHLGRCRFNNCHHDAEPDCAIRAAIASSEIRPERFESYQRIIAALGH
jgi:ribosome biogenesis GTPase